MRTLGVYRNGILAGTLQEVHRRLYIFTYDDRYFTDVHMPAVSVTMPKTQREYRSEYLFPFFFNMLSEGVNRNLQRTHWRIDEEDHFGLLATTAQYDTIGAITVKSIPGP